MAWCTVKTTDLDLFQTGRKQRQSLQVSIGISTPYHCGHTFLPFFNRWQCNVTTASNRRSKDGNFEKIDGKEFWDSKLSQPLKIRYQKNDNVEYVVFSWMMSKKEYFPLFFFSTCFSAFWSQCIHDAPPTQSNLSITPFPPWPEHGFSMATLSPIIMVQWKITTNWKSNYWCWGSFYHSPMMFGM